MSEQSLNERQRQQLSTCMASCRNIAYPSLGLVEEVGEYIQKLLYMIDWNTAFPASERDHLLMLLRGISTSAEAVGRINKMIRHGSYPQPFSLKPDYIACNRASVTGVMSDSLGESPNPFASDRIEALQKELGDVDWMVSASHFYTVHPDGTDPISPDAAMTAQFLADQNYRKLAERRAQSTIDGKGDSSRSSI